MTVNLEELDDAMCSKMLERVRDVAPPKGEARRLKMEGGF